MNESVNEFPLRHISYTEGTWNESQCLTNAKRHYIKLSAPITPPSSEWRLQVAMRFFDCTKFLIAQVQYLNFWVLLMSSFYLDGLPGGQKFNDLNCTLSSHENMRVFSFLLNPWLHFLCNDRCIFEKSVNRHSCTDRNLWKIEQSFSMFLQKKCMSKPLIIHHCTDSVINFHA